MARVDSPTSSPPRPPPDPLVAQAIRTAVAQTGGEIVAMGVLSQRAGLERVTVRVDLAGGERWKARHFESETAARDVFRAGVGLPRAFDRGAIRHGAVLLERWVPGRELPADCTEPQMKAAGEVLGSLHALPPEPASPPVATTPYRERAERRLGQLVGDELLGAGPHAALRAQLRDDATPDTVPAVRLHGDFRGENLVVDPSGALQVIDNEWLSIGPAGRDLGYTLVRWPLSAAQRAVFLGGYRAVCPEDPGPLGFWSVVAAVERTHWPHVIAGGPEWMVGPLLQLASKAR